MSLAWLPDARVPLPLAAIAYARHGMRVFPVRVDKTPATTHGHHDATTDVALIRGWRWKAGIGWALPLGLIALDVDARHRGHESLAALQATHGALPATFSQTTGSGGLHLFFRVPAGREARQLAPIRDDLPGLDTRVGGRGYVVVAPTRHQCGQRYAWRERLPVVEMPEWLAEFVCWPSRVNTSSSAAPALTETTGRRGRYAAAVLQGEVEAVAHTPEGERNHRLFRAWKRCGTDLADVLPRELVIGELTRAALSAGLSLAEIRRVLREGGPRDRRRAG